MEQNIRYTVTAQDLLSGILQGMNANANSLNNGMGQLQSTISKVGMAVGLAFGVQQISQFAQKVISAGTTVENATTGLTTLLGDSAEAVRVVQNTMQDATRTPFAFEGLLSANKALISSGIQADKARMDVLNLSNAIAATGGGDDELQRMVVNMQQISNTGKATAMDIKQFAFAGINIYKVLAEATNQPIEKVKDMEVSYNMLSFALAKAHEKGGIYFNGLENMANNTSVKISNVGDALFQSFVEVFQQIKPYLDNGLSVITSFISESKNNIQGVFKQIVNFFQPLAEPITILFNKIWSSVQKVYQSLSQFSSEGGSIFSFLISALGKLIVLFANWYEITYSFIAAVIDVAHTIFVILDKLGVIWAIGKSFELVCSVLKLIGSGLQMLYENIIKPIFDKILWAYNKVKELLGIKDQKIKITINKEENTTGISGIKNINSINSSTITKPTTKGTSGVQSNKAVTVNIQIGSLIHDFKISTTNIQESTRSIHDKVVQALTGAVNDSQLIAGQ